METLLEYSNPIAFEFPPKSNTYFLHLNCSTFLSQVQLHLPSMQRELDIEWCSNLEENMTSYIENNKPVDFGTFHVAYFDNIYYLLDGRHRYFVLSKLDKIYNNIYVQVKLYYIFSLEELHTIFNIINGSRPSKIYQSTSKQIMINTFRRHMTTKYGKFISKAVKPQKPNINLDHIVDKIVEKNLIENLNWNSENSIVNALENINNFYEKKFNSINKQDVDIVKSWKVKDLDGLVVKCKIKSILNPLFVGIYENYEWIDKILYVYENKLSFDDIIHVPINYRKKIGKRKRRDVWCKRNKDEIIGRCYVCDHIVDYDDFECGHILAAYWGGLDSLDNLEPICKTCNRDMGVQNLAEYKTFYY